MTPSGIELATLDL